MYREAIESYQPSCEQEERDKAHMLEAIEAFGDKILTRDCVFGHLTASSMIFNGKRDKVLMVYHRIYDSWSWTGGHADGEADLRQTAVREALEETGLKHVEFLREGVQALDVLTVQAHRKKGAYVSPHLHLNLAYLLEAEEGGELRVKEDENSGVQWIPVAELERYVTEEKMLPVYRKLMQKVSM